MALLARFSAAASRLDCRAREAASLVRLPSQRAPPMPASPTTPVMAPGRMPAQSMLNHPARDPQAWFAKHRPQLTSPETSCQRGLDLARERAQPTSRGTVTATSARRASHNDTPREGLSGLILRFRSLANFRRPGGRHVPSFGYQTTVVGLRHLHTRPDSQSHRPPGCLGFRPGGLGFGVPFE